MYIELTHHKQRDSDRNFFEWGRRRSSRPTKCWRATSLLVFNFNVSLQKRSAWFSARTAALEFDSFPRVIGLLDDDRLPWLPVVAEPIDEVHHHQSEDHDKSGQRCDACCGQGRWHDADNGLNHESSDCSSFKSHLVIVDQHSKANPRNNLEFSSNELSDLTPECSVTR